MILDQNKWLRLSMVLAFYFTQGVPTGLFLTAVPAWIASNGGSTIATGQVVSAYMLPWIWKFLTAFVMDRYTYLPMGRRRAWIIGAQSLLVLVFLASAVIEPPVGNVALLSAMALAAGFAASTQDVGIDGLSVDILREEERAVAAGLMFGASTLGISAAAFAGGQLIANVGISAAYVAAAVTVGTVLVFGMVVREREGEKLLPFSPGSAHPRNLHIQVEAWWPLLKHSFRALLSVASIAFLAVFMMSSMPFGVAETFHPVLTTQTGGWSQTNYTNTVSAAGLASGLVAMVVGGWSVSKIGEKNALMILFVLLAMLAVGFGFLHERWDEKAMLTAIIWGIEAIGLMLIVAGIPIAMRLCNPSVAATQFTIYMALSNLGRPIGAAMTTGIIAVSVPQNVYFALGGVSVLALVILWFTRLPAEAPEAVAAIERDLPVVEEEPVPDLPGG
ncbi:MFS transporter [Sphingomicrobium nitratireducens]|uniref:MFS transporter n=1 Tax=Sphingomicrobium nitratireducens TaxID=2964666 RepID=UPI002240D066|nr:MFS transporter [Sphingomicrobium nitratireducens]